MKTWIYRPFNFPSINPDHLYRASGKYKNITFRELQIRKYQEKKIAINFIKSHPFLDRNEMTKLFLMIRDMEV